MGAPLQGLAPQHAQLGLGGERPRDREQVAQERGFPAVSWIQGTLRETLVTPGVPGDTKPPPEGEAGLSARLLDFTHWGVSRKSAAEWGLRAWAPADGLRDRTGPGPWPGAEFPKGFPSVALGTTALVTGQSPVSSLRLGPSVAHGPSHRAGDCLLVPYREPRQSLVHCTPRDGCGPRSCQNHPGSPSARQPRPLPVPSPSEPRAGSSLGSPLPADSCPRSQRVARQAPSRRGSVLTSPLSEAFSAGFPSTASLPPPPPRRAVSLQAALPCQPCEASTAIWFVACASAHWLPPGPVRGRLGVCGT